MTRSEFFEIAENEVADTLLHASYSLPGKEFDAVQFAMHAMLSNLRTRLTVPAPKSVLMETLR